MKMKKMKSNTFLIALLLSLQQCCGALVQPRIQSLTSPKLILAEESIRLLCTMEKGSLAIEFVWLRNGDPLPAKANVQTETISTHTSILSFSAVGRSDAGNYTCLIRNRAGSDAASIEVDVKGGYGC